MLLWLLPSVRLTKLRFQSLNKFHHHVIVCYLQSFNNCGFFIYNVFPRGFKLVWLFFHLNNYIHHLNVAFTQIDTMCDFFFFSATHSEITRKMLPDCLLGMFCMAASTSEPTREVMGQKTMMHFPSRLVPSNFTFHFTWFIRATSAP